MSTSQRSPKTRVRAWLLVATGTVLTLAACGRGDDDHRVVRQELDRSVAPVARRAEEVRPEVIANGREATPEVTDAGANKAKDAAISVLVKGELAKDGQLTGLDIDVDTAGGRVLLRGTAPDLAARDRATRLAASVEGVRSVDNQLTVSPSG